MLVGASEVIDWSRRMKGKGVNGDAVRMEWPELMRFKRSFTEPVPRHQEEGFARAGIQLSMVVRGLSDLPPSRSAVTCWRVDTLSWPLERSRLD